jgi:hypothetical protein
MKMWQIFAVGCVGTVAAFLLPLYESVIAGTGALLVIAAVAFGFLLHPRRDMFYLGTAVPVADQDRMLSLERERLAIKVNSYGYGYCSCRRCWLWLF